jgi:hypothetical protein
MGRLKRTGRKYAVVICKRVEKWIKTGGPRQLDYLEQPSCRKVAEVHYKDDIFPDFVLVNPLTLT